MSKKAVVLVSGGLDSSVCLAQMVDELGAGNVVALSMSYGQKHVKELECAEKVTAYYGVPLISMDLSQTFANSNCSLLQHSSVDVPEKSYEESKKEEGIVSTYVPFRNGLFLSNAAAIAYTLDASVVSVIYGAHQDDAAGDAYPDCSTGFYKNMDYAIKIGTANKVQLFAPFVYSTKANIVKRGIELGVPFELTWSCYNGGSEPCGTCGTCIDRAKAFAANAAIDPAIGYTKEGK